MTLDQRIRAIRLAELIAEEPEMARELGVSIRHRIANQESEEKETGRWQEGSSAAIAR